MKKVLITLGICMFALGVVAQDCRVKSEDLNPVIDKFNPFFTDHIWNDLEKSESARLDPWRLITIRQKGCLRHHILIQMIIDKSQVIDDTRFWVQEVLIMMKRIYFRNSTYSQFKSQFERIFIQNFVAEGTNNLFNFPIGERTFIMRIDHGDWGAKITLEIVRLVIKENIILPGIDRQDDDGWFR